MWKVRIDELLKKLDELEAGQLTEVEKANKALEAANEQIAKLQKDNAIRDQREAAMTNFKITAEQAKTVVKDDGSLDYESLGKIMSDKETAAAQAKEQGMIEKSNVNADVEMARMIKLQRDRRSDRPQRRRQDHRVQPAHQRLPAL